MSSLQIIPLTLAPNFQAGSLPVIAQRGLAFMKNQGQLNIKNLTILVPPRLSARQLKNEPCGLNLHSETTKVLIKNCPMHPVITIDTTPMLDFYATYSGGLKVTTDISTIVVI